MTTTANLGSLQQLTMLAVARVPDGAFGGAIQDELTRVAGREVSVSTIYVTLARLEDQGLVTSHQAEPTAGRGGRGKRYYELTPAGWTALEVARDITRAYERGERLGTGLRSSRDRKRGNARTALKPTLRCAGQPAAPTAYGKPATRSRRRRVGHRRGLAWRWSARAVVDGRSRHGRRSGTGIPRPGWTRHQRQPGPWPPGAGHPDPLASLRLESLESSS
ncbi:MAG TPA: PadR family transcriptional regulator [Gemmatimonadetes bacterium]|nr:PadR family transcriptional regulator [Gemmatimonadota bacterium]